MFVPTVISLSLASEIAQYFLSQSLPNLFIAGDVIQENDTFSYWFVPVLLAYPGLGAIGMVGSIKVAKFVGVGETAVLGSTEISEMLENGRKLFEQNVKRIWDSYFEAIGEVRQ